MSADKSSRKRRRTSESHSPVFSEVEAEAPAERMIKVNHHKNEDQWTPILGKALLIIAFSLAFTMISNQLTRNSSSLDLRNWYPKQGPI